MGLWTPEHAATLLPAVVVMIVISLLLRKWLINKSFETRMIPIKVIAVILLLLELGKQIFSASMEGRSAKELMLSDYKEFHIAGYDLAVAQITCMDSPKMLERKEEFLALMDKVKKEKNL